jgi:hypothetical protein
MKNLTAPLLTSVVGAALAATALAGAPVVAHGAAAEKSAPVTSSQIKNGTIKKKDLSKPVVASLSKADTALQSEPLNGVSGAQVKNGSLTAADIAVATGSLTFDFPPIGGAGQCQLSPAIDTGKVLDNAIILVEGPFDVVGAVHMLGRPTAAGSTSFQILACDTGGAFDPPSESYTWAVIGG